MKIKDRYLIIRRAFIVAFNPKTESILLKVQEKSGRVYSRSIFTDKEKASHLFENDAMDMFSRNAKSADQLARTVTGFAEMIQDRWNKTHPDDPASFVNKDSK